jgi:hypothetical protein
VVEVGLWWSRWVALSEGTGVVWGGVVMMEEVRWLSRWVAFRRLVILCYWCFDGWGGWRCYGVVVERWCSGGLWLMLCVRVP